MRPDLYRPPDTDPRLGRGAHWLRDPNRPVKLLILLAVVVGLGAETPALDYADWMKAGQP